MSNMNTAFAYELGKSFAEELNSNPKEAQNWNLLSILDIPDGDYDQIAAHYNLDDLDDDELRSIKRAYVDGFNATFVAIGEIS